MAKISDGHLQRMHRQDGGNALVINRNLRARACPCEPRQHLAESGSGMESLGFLDAEVYTNRYAGDIRRVVIGTDSLRLRKVAKNLTGKLSSI